jgi:hypothetical protein
MSDAIESTALNQQRMTSDAVRGVVVTYTPHGICTATIMLWLWIAGWWLRMGGLL